MAALVEQKMREDDETVAVQLHVHAMLKEHGYNTSLRTIVRCWTSLRWIFRVLSANLRIEALRVGMAVYNRILRAVRSFSDVTWTDESSMQLESHQ